MSVGEAALLSTSSGTVVNVAEWKLHTAPPSLIILLKHDLDSHLMLFILQSLTQRAYSDRHLWL